jgi:hypothetical protein
MLLFLLDWDSSYYFDFNATVITTESKLDKAGQPFENKPYSIV